MAIERLTAEDEIMLWPDKVWPQDIGAIVLLEGGPLLDGAGGFRIHEVRKLVESRLHLVPRFRQLLHVPPPELGGPLWVDAQVFDIRRHVRAFPIDVPGDEGRLLSAVEHLRRRRLDRERPLWEMWFLTGLASGRVGLFVRMHHCIADGMASLATIARFLDVTPDASVADPPPWSPSPIPSEQELLDDARRRRAEARRTRVTALAHPARGARRVVAAWPAIRELVAGRALPPTSLDRVVGQGRRMALVRARLEPVKAVARAHGAKVNDVLLALITGGLRALLQRRGELSGVSVMRTYVPVSLHQGSRAEAHGNLISQMVVELPVSIAGPSERLRRIAGETAARKARARPALGVIPHSGLGGRLFLKLIDRQRVNVSSADLPGPEVPLYFAGARLLEVYPMVQLLAKNSLTVGALSYSGGFYMLVVGDRETYPDLDVFTDGMRAELGALGVDAAAKEVA